MESWVEKVGIPLRISVIVKYICIRISNAEYRVASRVIKQDDALNLSARDDDNNICILFKSICAGCDTGYRYYSARSKAAWACTCIYIYII